MGGRGGDRRIKNIPVAEDRRKTDRREKDIDPLVSTESYSGYSDVNTYPNGNYESFITVNSTDWQVLGVQVQLAENTLVQFYENGEIKSCVLAEPAKLSVHGVLAIAAPASILEFYQGGEIKKITLNKESRFFFGAKLWKYQDKDFPTGVTLEFSEDGQIQNPVKDSQS